MVVQHPRQSGDRLVHQRNTGRVDVVDRAGKRRLGDRGEVDEKATGVRADGFFTDRTLLEQKIACSRGQFAQAGAFSDHLEDRLVEVVAAEPLDALAEDHLVQPAGHLQQRRVECPPPRS